MQKKILAYAAAAVFIQSSSGGAHAQKDAANGKTLHDQHCLGCHIQQFGGDGSRVYTRENRRIKDYRALLQRVAACNAQTGAKWFSEEEADVAAYLNQRFYRFKP
ncbi:MAG: cytochrome c [Rhodocyclaceae bacterium]|nr:cytochrome c [Rhodocyclaceae bacterium]